MMGIRAFLHRTLPSVWQKRGLIARLLWPLSLLYGAILRSKQRATANTLRPPLQIPVLVVGNVIAGGAGKTPTTIAIVRYFQSLGIKTGVISRGYKRRSDAPLCITVQANSPAEDVGDEPLLLYRSTGLPVVVCAQRLKAAQALLEQYPDTQLIICDDGLQHLALPRDGEICVMDERGIGNGWLLPAGPLREPWPRRCDILLHINSTDAEKIAPSQLHSFTNNNQQEIYQAQRELAKHAVQSNGQRMLLQDWVTHKQPVHALAGIAQPERFFTMLRATGLNLKTCHALPDHAHTAEILALLQNLFTSGLPVLCTEKDAVKIWPIFPQVWAIPLLLNPEPAFFTALYTWWQQTHTKRHPSINT